ncbi:hypothetical protein B1H20_20975 [Streptomyces violaceoruber]|uniref:Uncharacterized protein n=1 Tax=Streptomyces violaceoruber TaxID=1935 RepID=A0A1V0UEL1_STRVN|nr:hypothetical protein B1H20_20975 [Streptomyces violaceoruber]
MRSAGRRRGVEAEVEEGAHMPLDVPPLAEHQREPARLAPVQGAERGHPAALLREVEGSPRLVRGEPEDVTGAQLHAQDADGVTRGGEDPEVDGLGDEPVGRPVPQDLEPEPALPMGLYEGEGAGRSAHGRPSDRNVRGTGRPQGRPVQRR